MTSECYQSECPYHGNKVDPGSGPFCDEPECREPNRFIKKEEKIPIEVQTIKRMRLLPGDIIVFRFPGRFSEKYLDAMRQDVEKHFPGHKIICLEEGADVEIISPEGEKRDG